MTFLRSLRAGLGPLLVHAGWTGIRRLTAYDELQVTLHHRFASQPHWFLAAIGVMPDRQGQGLGRRLIEPTLARADAHQVPCYLETQAEKNVAIYQRLGFRVCWTGTPKGHPVAVWAMRRDPSGTEQTFGSHASSD
jgi:GNAT superfamily N-acetyltransferase